MSGSLAAGRHYDVKQVPRLSAADAYASALDLRERTSQGTLGEAVGTRSYAGSMAGLIRIYDEHWRFEQEPSEELERRLYAVGLAVMWWGEDAEYQDPGVRGPGVWLEGGYQDQPAEALDLLAEVAPMAEELSWMLWWPVDEADDEMLHLSLVVAGELRELELPRPPTAEDLARLRRSATMASTVPSTAVIALMDELERVRDPSERRLTARRESLADAIEATISESGAETIDELRAAVRGRPPREPWDGDEAQAEGERNHEDMPHGLDLVKRMPRGWTDEQRLAAMVEHYVRLRYAYVEAEGSGTPSEGRAATRFEKRRTNDEIDADIAAAIERLGGGRLAEQLLAEGQRIVYLDGDDIVRKDPDGTREVIGRLNGAIDEPLSDDD